MAAQLTMAFPQPGLRLFFHYFPNIVVFKSWNLLIRQMGLTDREIPVARVHALGMQDALYEVLVSGLNKTGWSTSVNTSLDALEM